MTDKEIIKAFEACLNRLNRCVCTIDDCPYADNNECSIDLWKDALDLINRQQQEIERLKEDIDVLKSELNDCECKNYDLENHKIYSESVMGKVRAEAIRQFAEKLKEKMNNLVAYKTKKRDYYIVSKKFIDNLVKEMVGADNA